MGCWNNTCALTHLPIFWGDEVVVLANAVKTGPSHAYYHYFDEAMPIALPIYGKYDDYGRVEDYSMSDMTRQVLENMKFFSKEARKEAQERDAHVSRDIFKEIPYWWDN